MDSEALSEDDQAASVDQQAVVKIQNAFRTVRAVNELRAVKQAAVAIQSTYRGAQGRAKLGLLGRMAAQRGRARARKASFSGPPTPDSSRPAKLGDSSMLMQRRGRTQRLSRETASGSELVLTEHIARAKFGAARKAQQTESLHTKPRKASSKTPLDYAGTKAADSRRKALLFDARRLSPIDTVFRLDKIGQTALVPLFQHPGTWLVIMCYIATAVLTRRGTLHFVDVDRDTFEGGTTLVIFMIVLCAPHCCSGARAPPPPLASRRTVGRAGAATHAGGRTLDGLCSAAHARARTLETHSPLGGSPDPALDSLLPSPAHLRGAATWATATTGTPRCFPISRW